MTEAYDEFLRRKVEAGRASMRSGQGIPNDAVAAKALARLKTSILQLSPEDQQRFAESLLNPPEPNAALKQAAQQHRAQVEIREKP